MKNAIVVCATPNWLAPAAVTLLSCAQHGAADTADLILVSFDTSKNHLTNLQLFNQKHRVNIKLLSVSLDDLQEMGRGRLGVGSLMRLKLDEFLPADYDRILYLDSDVLAEASCNTLFETDLQGHSFAAVENTALLPWIKRNSAQHLAAVEMLPSQKYFNAGVMLFDWQKTRQSGLMAKSLEAMKLHSQWPYQDQDALNSVSKGEFKLLDHRWNVTKKTADYLKISPRFRHFNGAAKPWNCKSRFGFARYHRYYAESLAGTPWQSFMSQTQQSWPFRDNWRAMIRGVSFGKIGKLKKHISLVTEAT